MIQEVERRTEGGPRCPFEQLVEVGGAAFPPFEAQSLDVTREGMHLRSAYLPEIGTSLSVRFDGEPGDAILATAEVVWREPHGGGGDLGLRFSSLDSSSEAAIRRILEAKKPAPIGAGTRVHLQIEGMGSSMAARVREGRGASGAVVVSKLGFLSLGKTLAINDVDTGSSRTATIEDVNLEVHPDSRVPQLVIGLAYADAPAAVRGPASVEADPFANDGSGPMAEDPSSPEAVAQGSERPNTKKSESQLPSAVDEDELDVAGMKGSFAKKAAQITPALLAFAKRAKLTATLLAVRASKGDSRSASPTPSKRTTSRAPGGGLTSQGKKVIRDEAWDEQAEGGLLGAVKSVDRRKLAIGGAVGVALILGAVAMRRPPAAVPPLAVTTEVGVAAGEAPPGAAVAAVTPATAGNPGIATPSAAGAPAVPEPIAQAIVPAAPAIADADAAPHPVHPKKLHVTPFSNGAVSHANVLRLKMDSPIEKIEGASQPAGFTVNLPGVKSLEAAGPLASRDSRIASIKVTNDKERAELSVSFKDGVPHYQVRAKGDVLEIALAPIGAGSGAKEARDDAGDDESPTGGDSAPASASSRSADKRLKHAQAKSHGHRHSSHADHEPGHLKRASAVNHIDADRADTAEEN